VRCSSWRICSCCCRGGSRGSCGRESDRLRAYGGIGLGCGVVGVDNAIGRRRGVSLVYTNVRRDKESGEERRGLGLERD